MAHDVKHASSAALRVFESSLEHMGWLVRAVEVDLVNDTARVELKRISDHRLVTFDARNGRSTITREVLVTELVTYRGLPQYKSAYRLMGRTTHEGMRWGMRMLATYIADNSADGCRLNAKNAFRALLSAG